MTPQLDTSREREYLAIMVEGISNALKDFTSEDQEIIVAMLAAYRQSGTDATYAAFVHGMLAIVHEDIPVERLDKIVKGMNKLKFRKIDFGPAGPGTNLNLDVVSTGPGYDRVSTDMSYAPTGDGVSRNTQGAREQGEDPDQ